MKQLTYNYRGMLASSIGKNGLSTRELKSLERRLAQINHRFTGEATGESTAFIRLLDAAKEIKNIKALANDVSKRFENLIVVGIGGSDLGARAVISALVSHYNNELPSAKRRGMKIYFCGDTTDPQPLRELLEILDLKKTAVHVISKSGSTIETLSAFAAIRQKMIAALGNENHRPHIIVTTEANDGALFKIAKANEYTILPHDDIGGRFSLLSSVGLFPVACAGIDIDELIKGAAQIRESMQFTRMNRNPAFAYAAVHYALAKKKKNIAVLMPYAYKLKTFGAWYRQLWAESLGKDGLGQTPVAAVGPTDQHSQLQLYQDGPNDKAFTFISIEKRDDLKVPDLKEPALKYFKNRKFSDILELELQATAKALREHWRPTGTLTMPDLSARSLGQLIFFFELATAYSGALYKINAFDQPGVELMKKYLKQMLAK